MESKSDSDLSRHHGLLLALFPMLRLIVWAIFLVLGPFKVLGRNRVPAQGGLIILSNHLADLDPVAVQFGCPRPIFFMAKSELFEMKVVGSMLRLFGAFPVKRGEPDRGAIKKAVAYARAGNVVCIFPEGELSESGSLQPLKPGVALIIRMAEVPVIACRLDNTNRAMPYGKLIPRPAWCRLTVRWSEPQSFGKHAEAREILDWAESQLSG